MTTRAVSVFEQQVDKWVLRSISSGITEFATLLSILPGVYPSIAIDSMKRLASLGIIPKSALADTLAYVIQKKTTEIQNTSDKQYRVVPHPLDYDWRFSKSATKRLADYSCEFSDTGDTIALLGVPSLFSYRHRLPESNPFSKREVTLIDKDHVGKTYDNNKTTANDQTTLHFCDLLRDDLPNVMAQVVVTDPPWYPEYTHAFLWSATQVCRIGGYVFLCFPPVGTRPTIRHELRNILSWAEDLGLTFIKYEPNVLSYVSPPFERNALRAEGIMTVPNEWRSGDLAIFSRTRKSLVARPPAQTEESCWKEVTIKGVRIRVRNQKTPRIHNPMLVSIIPNDILPSVSRRDPKRKLADVWTSGNRIFACSDCNILLKILNAMARERSPYDDVSSQLNRKLESYEKQCISNTISAINRIVELERQEQEEFGYGA